MLASNTKLFHKVLAICSLSFLAFHTFSLQLFDVSLDFDFVGLFFLLIGVFIKAFESNKVSLSSVLIFLSLAFIYGLSLTLSMIIFDIEFLLVRYLLCNIYIFLIFFCGEHVRDLVRERQVVIYLAVIFSSAICIDYFIDFPVGWSDAENYTIFSLSGFPFVKPRGFVDEPSNYAAIALLFYLLLKLSGRKMPWKLIVLLALSLVLTRSMLCIFVLLFITYDLYWKNIFEPKFLFGFSVMVGIALQTGILQNVIKRLGEGAVDGSIGSRVLGGYNTVKHGLFDYGGLPIALSGEAFRAFELKASHLFIQGETISVTPLSIPSIFSVYFGAAFMILFYFILAVRLSVFGLVRFLFLILFISFASGDINNSCVIVLLCIFMNWKGIELANNNSRSVHNV